MAYGVILVLVLAAMTAMWLWILRYAANSIRVSVSTVTAAMQLPPTTDTETPGNVGGYGLSSNILPFNVKQPAEINRPSEAALSNKIRRILCQLWGYAPMTLAGIGAFSKVWRPRSTSWTKW